jgi:hypothetical protein
MNKLFAVLIMCSLSLPVLAIEEQGVELTPVNDNALETVQPQDSNTIEMPEVRDSLQPVPTQLPSRYKAPMSKKKLAKKFIIAMLCVAGASVFLYGTLSVYNKIRDGFVSSAPELPEGEKPLDAPNDLTEAVKTFIDKTRWEN